MEERDLDETTMVRIRVYIDTTADKLGEVLKNLSVHAAAQNLKLVVDDISYENPNKFYKITGDN